MFYNQDINRLISDKKFVIDKLVKMPVLLQNLVDKKPASTSSFDVWLSMKKRQELKILYVNLKKLLHAKLEKSPDNRAALFMTAIRKNKLSDFFSIYPDVLDFFRKALHLDNSLLEQINDEFVQFQPKPAVTEKRSGMPEGKIQMIYPNGKSVVMSHGTYQNAIRTVPHNTLFSKELFHYVIQSATSTQDEKKEASAEKPRHPYSNLL